MSIRDRWPTLTARERDCEVAKLQGWTEFQHVDWCELRGIPPDGSRQYETVPYYVGDWMDAGPLLEELRLLTVPERGGVKLFGDGDDRDEAPWEVSIYWAEKTPVDEPDIYVFAATAPEAIALAYCLAKESGD